MHKQSYQEPIEIFFMNALPFSVREASIKLLKNFMLDELMAMRLDQHPQEKSAEFNLTTEQWEITLNNVVLTKLTYFSIHPQLPKVYLLKLISIAAFALDKPGANVNELIEHVDQDATIMHAWLKNIKAALPRAK